MRVALVSTHRSDRGHYAPLRRLLEADERFEVVVVSERLNLDGAFDVAVVLGDRYEMFLSAAHAVELRIPLLHIHGGEHTYGSLDERWRWAMTMIADVHCVATEEAGKAVTTRFPGYWLPYLRQGLPTPLKPNVYVTGAPGLDGITERQPFPNAPRIVVLYNPAIDEETTKREADAINEAILSLDVASWLYIKPNGDRFAEVIPWSHSGDELDSEKFRDLLASAHVIVGNSSAGIIEAPSLGTWTVNVGERQAGRPRAGSILDVKADATLICRAITDMLLQPRHTHANPYGDGHACERIRDVLLGMA